MIFGKSTFFLIFFLFYISLGCLITNCPKGGKRNHPNLCPRCGPDSLGRCVSEGICCGPVLGCLLNPDECPKKDLKDCIFPSRQVCSESGRCVTNGLCCEQDGCRWEEACFFEREKL